MPRITYPGYPRPGTRQLRAVCRLTCRRGRVLSAWHLIHPAFGADVPARAVLDELSRVGAIRQQPNGNVTLLTNAYVPSSDEDEKLTILGNDVAELIATIDHNIRRPEAPFFQRKVSYDRLPAEFVERLRETAATQAQLLLEQFDREMSAHDLDSAATADSPVGTGEQRLASIGIYYFESRFDKEAPQED